MAWSQAFKGRYGPWALVTGAAWGMGTEYARQIGALGLNLVLVDIRGEELERVAEEVRRTSGVDVMALMPGATRTTGFEHSGARLERSTLAPLNEPGPTVAEALRMLGRTPSWIPGRRNRWTLTLAARLLPRRMLIGIVGSNMRQWYGT